MLNSDRCRDDDQSHIHHFSLQGLYAITDAALQPAEQLVSSVHQALKGGAKLIQYRDKSTHTARRLQQASALTELCNQFQVPLIINDDIKLAQACRAHGVHLGQNDSDPKTARQQLGEQAIIGVSCYDQWSLAVQAATLKVDYIAFGRFFSSRTKPNALQANMDLIPRAGRQLQIPVVAIGGITPENGSRLVAAGASMLAAIHGVFAAADITAAAQAYTQLFKE